MMRIRGWVHRLRNKFTDFLWMRKVEDIWERPCPQTKVVAVETCSVELWAMFQTNPTNAEAKKLASLASGVASEFGKVTSSIYVAERGEDAGKSSKKPGGTLRTRLVLRPKNGKLDWVALNKSMRDTVSKRYKRFKVLLEDPARIVPTGPSAGGLDGGMAV